MPCQLLLPLLLYHQPALTCQVPDMVLDEAVRRMKRRKRVETMESQQGEVVMFQRLRSTGMRYNASGRLMLYGRVLDIGR